MNLIICGGGFQAFWYNYGRLESKKLDLKDFQNIIAYSSGAIALILHLSQVPLRNLIDVCLNIKDTYSNTAYLTDIVRIFLNEILPENIHDILNSHANIRIAITTKRFRTEYKTEWENKRDVIEDIVASSYLPFISGRSFAYKNQYIDGSFSLDLWRRYIFQCNDVYINYVSCNLLHICRPITEKQALIYYKHGLNSL